MPNISVIVATRNRRSSLDQFLKLVRGFDTEPSWELIVVDNGSSDGTDKLLRATSGDLPMRVFEERQPGKSRALNQGLGHARGDILLFADDDILPEQQWLKELHRAAINYPGANVFGGRILIDPRTTPNWVMDSYNLKSILTSEQDFGEEIQWFGVARYPVGPNLAVRRRAMENRRFEWPVNLGPGTRLPLGDERAFLMQFSLPEQRDRLYVPASVVRHTLAGREINITNALTRCFLGGYAAGIIDRHYGRVTWESNAEIAALAWRRYQNSASKNETICSAVRAFGVVLGRVSPFTRIDCR